MKWLVEWWVVRRTTRRNRCRVDEKWGGQFIGRRFCSTHSYRWDPGQQPCPGYSWSDAGALPPGRWVKS